MSDSQQQRAAIAFVEQLTRNSYAVAKSLGYTGTLQEYVQQILPPELESVAADSDAPVTPVPAAKRVNLAIDPSPDQFRLDMVTPDIIHVHDARQGINAVVAQAKDGINVAVFWTKYATDLPTIGFEGLFGPFRSGRACRANLPYEVIWKLAPSRLAERDAIYSNNINVLSMLNGTGGANLGNVMRVSHGESYIRIPFALALIAYACVPTPEYFSEIEFSRYYCSLEVVQHKLIAEARIKTEFHISKDLIDAEFKRRLELRPTLHTDLKPMYEVVLDNVFVNGDPFETTAPLSVALELAPLLYSEYHVLRSLAPELFAKEVQSD